MKYQIAYIEQQDAFDEAMDGLREASWIGFDTEFVGEKSFIPRLCLLQIVSETHVFLIDTINVQNLRTFLYLVENPGILKITHAGDNDYRLLNQLFGTVPVNTFDTQIAAGFVGYNYPAGFAKIVDRELSISLAKSHTVADWEARPLDPKAIDYAIEDVKYLPTLYQKLHHKLVHRGRDVWAKEENEKWESAQFYQLDPYKEVLSNDFIHQLNAQDKLVLVRLVNWRREKAAELNVPKDAVLQSKHISSVVRALRDGQNAFRANRTLPENIWKRNQSTWLEFRKRPASPEEKDFLLGIPSPAPDDPEKEWSMELLYHFVKKQCLEHEISAALLLPRGDFNKIKSGEMDGATLLHGWRSELLGQQLTEWLVLKGEIDLKWIGQNACELRMRDS